MLMLTMVTRHLLRLVDKGIDAFGFFVRNLNLQESEFLPPVQ